MKIQTFSIVTGGTACNARCPFCVSRMTGDMDVANLKDPEVNWRNFRKACKLAAKAGATTAMLTGKGEPLLWTELITQYMEQLYESDLFPIIELQTNGLLLPTKPTSFETSGYDMFCRLRNWYSLGLTTVAISVVHWKPSKNKSIYTPNKEYFNLPAVIKTLHDVGFSVRLCCVMAKDYVDDFYDVKEMIEFTKEHGVEQLTFTPVSVPSMSEDQDATQWILDHYLDPTTDIEAIISGLILNGAMEIMQLPHGARVFDFHGQNVCFNNCLNPGPDELNRIRNLIFFPNGTVRYKWDSEGSIIF